MANKQIEYANQLKQALVDSLIYNEQIADMPYISTRGGHSYTRRELAKEIADGTEFGINTVVNVMKLTIEALAFQRTNETEKNVI